MVSIQHAWKEPYMRQIPDVSGPLDESVAADVVSDPALSDKIGYDWTDEGGATPTGPATGSLPVIT
ncbi:hypothetical protein CIK84_15020 [Glutamicibacter arilaitensis]|uniref:Uncharacterized protein n=2 Tax=Glutamicibacter arilaitensis TaxID=256701 RepID=A0A2N7S1A0_9MICC|nr:hypothetical protein CIK84_15020 [Glutamicibacter arilaitensis]